MEVLLYQWFFIVTMYFQQNCGFYIPNGSIVIEVKAGIWRFPARPGATPSEKIHVEGDGMGVGNL